jgi:hypothetical protein
VVLVDTKVATIYMRPAMSVPLEVGPGRTILLRGGYGEVSDPGAMPTLLCDPRLTIEIAERYKDHLPLWLETMEKQVRKPQAKVILPSGVHLDPPHYSDVIQEDLTEAAMAVDADPLSEPALVGWTPSERTDAS